MHHSSREAFADAAERTERRWPALCQKNNSSGFLRSLRSQDCKHAAAKEIGNRSPSLRRSPPSCAHALIPGGAKRLSHGRLTVSKGSPTPLTLLNFWFQADHKLKTGRPFKYDESQQEAIETLTMFGKSKRWARAKTVEKSYKTSPTAPTSRRRFRAPLQKIAVGSGKTKGHGFGCRAGNTSTFAASRRHRQGLRQDVSDNRANEMALEPLKFDSADGNIFREDPIRPKNSVSSGTLTAPCAAKAKRPYSEGALFLTNIQQFYERPDRGKDESPTP